MTETMYKYLILIFINISIPAESVAQNLFFENEDSTKIIKILHYAPIKNNIHEYVMYFGLKFKNIPYVAKTLDVCDRENLIINIREFDCTTFLENVLALSLCMKNNKKTFMDFANYLRLIRYKNGHISYISRLHYFTSWIDNNINNKYIIEGEQTKLPYLLFRSTQTLSINYMTQHISQYPPLLKDSSLISGLKQTEISLTGKKYKFIPKSMMKNYKIMKKYIHNGDIIAILTNKKGLDTSHIGIASWHSDGMLHLLNASQLHKKVVDEPLPIYKYLNKHPSQIGIRVIHPI